MLNSRKAEEEPLLLQQESKEQDISSTDDDRAAAAEIKEPLLRRPLLPPRGHSVDSSAAAAEERRSTLSAGAALLAPAVQQLKRTFSLADHARIVALLILVLVAPALAYTARLLHWLHARLTSSAAACVSLGGVIRRRWRYFSSRAALLPRAIIAKLLCRAPPAAAVVSPSTTSASSAAGAGNSSSTSTSKFAAGGGKKKGTPAGAVVVPRPPALPPPCVAGYVELPLDGPDEHSAPGAVLSMYYELHAPPDHSSVAGTMHRSCCCGVLRSSLLPPSFCFFGRVVEPPAVVSSRSLCYCFRMQLVKKRSSSVPARVVGRLLATASTRTGRLGRKHSSCSTPRAAARRRGSGRTRSRRSPPRAFSCSCATSAARGAAQRPKGPTRSTRSRGTSADSSPISVRLVAAWEVAAVVLAAAEHVQRLILPPFYFGLRHTAANLCGSWNAHCYAASAPRALYRPSALHHHILRSSSPLSSRSAPLFTLPSSAPRHPPARFRVEPRRRRPPLPRGLLPRLRPELRRLRLHERL